MRSELERLRTRLEAAEKLATRLMDEKASMVSRKRPGHAARAVGGRLLFPRAFERRACLLSAVVDEGVW